MDWKIMLGVPSAIATLVGGGFAVDARYAKQDDVIILQVQSFEYCQKILEDLQAQMARLTPGSPKWLALNRRYEYYKKICGMK